MIHLIVSSFFSDIPIYIFDFVVHATYNH
jgi:hypothetical protein